MKDLIQLIFKTNDCIFFILPISVSSSVSRCAIRDRPYCLRHDFRESISPEPCGHFRHVRSDGRLISHPFHRPKQLRYQSTLSPSAHRPYNMTPLSASSTFNHAISTLSSTTGNSVASVAVDTITSSSKLFLDARCLPVRVEPSCWPNVEVPGTKTTSSLSAAIAIDQLPMRSQNLSFRQGSYASPSEVMWRKRGCRSSIPIMANTSTGFSDQQLVRLFNASNRGGRVMSGADSASTLSRIGSSTSSSATPPSWLVWIIYAFIPS
ncbi:unnamed protein product [Protopolystoma xenopodis]|uniref:Uncharacterized protein n=1 Tax=Protopolystoma xenopodis TaxID=117903 RepID=A0A3S5BZN3_9PLAT|nr:unnamed protein product [Protopolystoma xenopodis]